MIQHETDPRQGCPRWGKKSVSARPNCRVHDGVPTTLQTRHDWGGPLLLWLPCSRGGAARIGWARHPTGTPEAVGGVPGHAERFPAPGTCPRGGPGCGAAAPLALGQASTLSATELTNSPNQNFGVWKNGGGGWEGNGEIAGIAHGMWVVEGCGGMWLRKMGEMGGKWEENGRKMGENTHLSPIFPFTPFFWRSKVFPTIPFVNTSSPHSMTEKWESFATHRHSPPRWPVRMLCWGLTTAHQHAAPS